MAILGTELESSPQHYAIQLQPEQYYDPGDGKRRIEQAQIKKPENPESSENTETFGKRKNLDNSKNSEKFQKTEKPEKILQVFIAASSKNPFDEMPGTGDIDYVHTVAKGVEAETPFQAIPIQGLHDEKEIFAFIDAKKNSPYPLLHLHLNFPGTGTAFSLEGLKAFKARGGKLVITAIEFAKYSDSSGYKEMMLQYLALADSVLFLDEIDKQDAIQAATKPSLLETKYASEKGMQSQQCTQDQQYIQIQQRMQAEKLRQATIMPLMPTIPVFEHNKLRMNIISFGMIRAGKGLAHIIKLAKLIKKHKEPEIYNIKILMVGSVQEHPDSKNQELFKLMSVMYPDKKVEMEGKNIKELKELLKAYQAREQNGELQFSPAIPIELHLDVPKEKLNDLFEQCQYAFLPAYRGATLRNSSMVNALSNGFVVYSHKTQFTPPCLLPGGEHHGAIVLNDSDDYGLDTNGDCDFNGYANAVLQDILVRSKDKWKSNSETLSKAKRLREALLSDDIIFGQFSTVYRTTMRLEHPEYLAFLDWQADFNTKRSYAKFKAVQKIDIEKQDAHNFKTLLSNLKTVTGPYSPAMKSFFLEKLKGKTLSPEEKRVFSVLMQSPWFIKHVTAHYAVIRRGGNRLLSLDHRQRMGDRTLNSHTMSSEGNTDNVFMSMNPGEDFETVRFLDSVTTEISGNVNVMTEKGASVLKGTWSSGHIYAFITEQDGEPVNLFGTLYQVRYRKKMDVQTGKEEWIKECVFSHSDGTEIIQTVRKQDEIFMHPRIDIAVALMTIEKCRLLGRTAWENIMKADAKTLVNLVQMIYNSGVFEVHKPAQFLLDEPGVSVIKRKAKAHGFDQYDQETMRPLIEAALMGDVDLVLKSLRDDLPLDTSVHCNGFSLNLLAAAILGGHPNLVAELLERGVEIHSRDIFILKGKDKKGIIHTHSMGLLGFVALLSNPEYCRTALKIILGDKLKHEPKILHESAITIAELLIKQGSKFKGNRHITRPVNLPYYDLMHILYYFQPTPTLIEVLLQAFHGKGENLPLVEAVSLRSPVLVELFLKRGAEVNEITEMTEDGGMKSEFQLSNQLPESTPLIAAINLDDLTLVKLLIQYKADVNRAYTLATSSGGLEGQLLRITENEGISPLMMAVKRGNLEICRFLVEAGADIAHRSLCGHTAFSLARALKRDDILALLKSVLMPLRSYPLHAASAKSDWVTCKLLMQEIGADRVLDTEGRSAYDINPGLLKQPFVPSERQIESYQGFVDQVRVLLIFQNREGERYFMVHKSPFNREESAAYFLSFVTCAPNDLTIKNMMKFFARFNIAQSEKDFVLKHLGTLSAGIPDKGIFYAERVVTMEFGPESLATLEALTGDQGFVLVPARLVQEQCNRGSRAHQKESKTLQEQQVLQLQYNGCTLSKMTTALLQVLSSKKAITAFSKAELEMLQSLYREGRTTLHQMRDLAKCGDLVGIAAILQQSGFSANMPISRLEREPYDADKSRTARFYGEVDTVMRTALFAGHLDCAYQLARQHGAQFTGHMSYEALDIIIKAGHVGFLKYYCEHLEEMQQDVKQMLAPLVLKIIKFSKVELLEYLMENQLMETSPEKVIEVCKDFLSVDVIKALLPKVTNPKKLAGLFSGAMYFYDVDGNYKDDQGSSSYDHMSREERNQRIIELFNLLKPYFDKAMIGNKSMVQSWLKDALKKENFAFIETLLKFQSYSSEDNLMLEPIFEACEKELKEKEAKVFSILARLIDPKGSCSVLIAPAVNRFLKSKVMSEAALLEKLEQLYQKTAPEHLDFRRALQMGDSKTVMEFLDRGFDVNSSVFLGIPPAPVSPQVAVAATPSALPSAAAAATPLPTSVAAVVEQPQSPFATPLQIALKAKNYDCVKVLVERGAKDLTLVDLQEMVRAGQCDLVQRLSKNDCKFLRKQIYELYDLLRIACETKNAAMLTVILNIDCPDYAIQTYFRSILTLCVESSDNALLQTLLQRALSKATDLTVSSGYGAALYAYLSKKNVIGYHTLPWSTEQRNKLEEDSAFMYQVTKALLQQRGADCLHNFVPPDYEIALLYLWGMKHEKEFTEQFEIMLKARKELQDKFFAECWRGALSNLDFKQITWLLQHRAEDLKNNQLIQSFKSFQPISALEFLTMECASETNWKEKGEKIVQLVQLLLQAGADPVQCRDAIKKSQYLVLEKQNYKTAILSVLDQHQKPKADGEPITLGFDLKRRAERSEGPRDEPSVLDPSQSPGPASATASGAGPGPGAQAKV